jgi:hypothetical protein
MAIDASLTLREAAAHHLADEGLEPDAGANSRWVKTKIGPIPFAYPNTKGRKKLLVAHDLHHLLADYRTDLVGEAEMGAWELGTGMDDRTGVRLAIRVFGFALPWSPRRVFQAFVRGRNCRNLLGRPLDDAALERSVAEARAELGLDRSVPAPTEADRRAFRISAAKAVAIVWGPLVPMAAVGWWWLG